MERIKFVVFVCIVVGLFSWFVFYLWNCILDCSVVGRVSVYLYSEFPACQDRSFRDKLDLSFKVIVDNKPNDPGSS
jgi:hypothetical protein